MAIRLLLPLVLFALAAIAHARDADFDLDPKDVMKFYDDAPLECYVKNNVTNAVELQVCRAGGHHSPAASVRDSLLDENVFRPIAAYPACFMVKTMGRRGPKMEQTCMLLPSLSVDKCGRACHENEKNRFYSDCCCTTTGCNGKMIPRPHAVLELDDE